MSGHPQAGSIGVADQQRIILAAVAPLPPRRVPLDEARCLVLAEDVHSATHIPPFDNSAMDGYAVHRDDLLVASPEYPVMLRVVADLAAGTALNPRLGVGEAARIMTGAPLPDEADAVVPLEATDRGTKTVAIAETPLAAAHIRRAGEDLHAGDLVLSAGTMLSPSRLAAVASAGRATVLVHPNPRVAVISTGTELVDPGSATRRGQIPDSNSFLLAAAVAEAGAEPIRIGAVPDDEQALAELLSELAASVDVIVLSGGVSVGAYDVVKAVLAPQPGMWFGAVRMQPGKPQGFGRWSPIDLKDGGPRPVVFALPGNPVSAFVSFEVFVRPALLRLRGLAADQLHRPTLQAVVDDGWMSPATRAQYMPVAITGQAPTARISRATAGGSGSHLVAGLAHAAGLAIVPEDVQRVRAGDTLTVMLT
jgi:molybdenum cofactor synthesis domain-containing protein